MELYLAVGKSKLGLLPITPNFNPLTYYLYNA